MLRQIAKSKIHNAVITQANLEYTGSITIDQTLVEAAGLVPYEKVQVVNLNTGMRIETYVIPGEPGSGIIGMNGGAAHHGVPGEKLIIMSYCLMDEEEQKNHKIKLVLVDENNRIME